MIDPYRRPNPDSAAEIGHAVPGLPDRAAYMLRLEAAIRMAERQQSGFAVLLIDSGLNPASTGLLDMEHLDQVAAAIRSTVRLSDTVAFISGNEFAVLLSVGNEGGAVRLAGKIVAALAGLGLSGVAAGVALFGMHGREGLSLLRAAESALFQARRAHQSVALASKAEMPPEPSPEELEERIGAAIQEDEFLLHFQPIVKLQSGAPVAVEALARWHHPQLGLLPPAEFLHLAEHDGTLVELSLRLVDGAMALLRGWRDRGLSLSMSLNLAIGMLEREGADQIILACLSGLALPPEVLTLELRDEGLLERSPIVLKNLFGLASAGVCLSIDDFGRGAGSIRALRDLPVQEIKLDPLFVSEICRSEADAAIVGALISLGRKLGKTVIAKGIESAEVCQKLRELGCEYGQGFYFARALGADELERWSRVRSVGDSL